MDDKGIDKIAQAIAAKLAEPGGNKLLGCGSASSSQDYYCSAYACYTGYECGGAAAFSCNRFNCVDGGFRCAGDNVSCTSFQCGSDYTSD